jgi:hypothetical protein
LFSEIEISDYGLIRKQFLQPKNVSKEIPVVDEGGDVFNEDCVINDNDFLNSRIKRKREISVGKNKKQNSKIRKKKFFISQFEDAKQKKLDRKNIIKLLKSIENDWKVGFYQKFFYLIIMLFVTLFLLFYRKYSLLFCSSSKRT